MTNTEYFIHRLNSIKPKFLHDIRKFGTLNWLGEGAFRDVYTVGKLPIVIKFPKDGNKECVTHSREEIDAYYRILNEFPTIQKYLPKILYSNKTTGVVVMKRYLPCVQDSATITKMRREIRDCLELRDWDGKANNFGYQIVKGKREYKVIDLGLLVNGFGYYKDKDYYEENT